MIGWVVLIAVLFLAWTFMRAKHFKSKIWAMAMILVIIFLYTSLSSVIKENGVNVKTFDGLITAGKLYFDWLGTAFDNTKTIIGNAIKMDWITNSSVK